MSYTPLGSILVEIKFAVDEKSSKGAEIKIKNLAKKMGKTIKTQVSQNVESGIDEGAKKGGEKLGRGGFWGMGFNPMTPFRPKVMGSYISSMYMHKAVTTVLRIIEDAVTDFISNTKHQTRMKEMLTDPLEADAKDVGEIKRIANLNTKQAFYLREITKGTDIDSTKIAYEIKKMKDAGIIPKDDKGVKELMDIYALNEDARINKLHQFDGSESLAKKFRDSNVVDNLMTVLSPKELDNYAKAIDTLLEIAEKKEKQALLDRASIIRSGSDYGIDRILEQKEKERKIQEEKQKKTELAIKTIEDRKKVEELYKNIISGRHLDFDDYSEVPPFKENLRILRAILDGINKMISILMPSPVNKFPDEGK